MITNICDGQRSLVSRAKCRMTQTSTEQRQSLAFPEHTSRVVLTIFKYHSPYHPLTHTMPRHIATTCHDPHWPPFTTHKPHNRINTPHQPHTPTVTSSASACHSAYHPRTHTMPRHIVTTCHKPTDKERSRAFSTQCKSSLNSTQTFTNTTPYAHNH